MISRLLMTSLLFLVTSWSSPAQSADTRVLIVGDSIMQALARSLERDFSRQDNVEASSFTAIGSGLARMDLFDWHEQIERRVAQNRPSHVVIMMGANDNQPMRVNGDTLRVGTPEWSQEYARRAGRAMDIMIEGGVGSIYWIELPDMRDARLQRDVQIINDLVAREAATRPRVQFHRVRHILSRTPGTFSPYIIRDNGMPLDIRSGDGVHLNRQGADYLSERLLPVVLGNAAR